MHSSANSASSAPITAITQPALRKNRPFWRQYSSKVFGLDGLAALVAPDTGIFHDRVAVEDHHQAAGELKTKNMACTSLFC